MPKESILQNNQGREEIQQQKTKEKRKKVKPYVTNSIMLKKGQRGGCHLESLTHNQSVNNTNQSNDSVLHKSLFGLV